MNQRGSSSPCSGCDNRQLFLKFPRWLQPQVQEGGEQEAQAAGGAERREEEGWEDSQEKRDPTNSPVI